MLKVILRFIANIIAEEFVLTWVIPSTFTVGVGLVGWVYGIPPFYLAIGVIFSFAAIPTGLLRFSEWKYRVTVKDKLIFANIRVRKILPENESSVIGVSLGFQLRNIATFPIEFSVPDIKTELLEEYSPNKPFLVETVTVPPGNNGWFDDHKIELKGNQWNGKTLEGSIRARIKYGRPGNLKQEIALNKKVYVKFDNHGNVLAEQYNL